MVVQNMKQIRLLILISLLVGMSGCDFQGIAIGQPILIVDLDAVANATGRKDVMQKEIEFANLKLTEQLKLVASQLEQNLEQERDKLGKKPSTAQKKELEQLVLQAQQQLSNSKNLAIQQSTNFRSDLILNFRNEVKEIAQKIAKRVGGKLVVVSNYETIWFDSSIDITDEVIAVLRAGKPASGENGGNAVQNNGSGEESK